MIDDLVFNQFFFLFWHLIFHIQTCMANGLLSHPSILLCFLLFFFGGGGIKSFMSIVTDTETIQTFVTKTLSIDFKKFKFTSF